MLGAVLAAVLVTATGMPGDAMDETPEAVIAHAARRWADLVIRAIQSRSDPRTIEHWSRTAGASPSTVRSVCAAAGWKPKASLDFARVLRAATLAQAHRRWEPYNLLDIVDPRTLRRFLQAAGIPQKTIPPRADDIVAYHANQIHHTVTKAILDAATSLAMQPSADARPHQRP